MEEIKAEVRLGELKRENLRKSLEEVRAQASSLLLFTLQWNELENHFDLVQEKIDKRIEVAELREKQLETTELQVKLKEEDLKSVSKLLERCSPDLSSKKEELGYLQKLIVESREQLKVKVEQLGSLEKQIEESNKEISLKKENLDLLQLSVEESERKLESGKTELGLVTKKVDEICDEVCFKNGQLEELQRSIDEKSVELKAKEMDLDLKENMVNECDQALGLKMKELEYMQNSIKECSHQLDLKQAEIVRNQEVIEEHSKQLDEKEKILNSVKSLIQDFNEELETKEKKYHELDKSVRDHAVKIKSKEKELELIEEKVMDRSEELHSRNIEFDSLQSLIRTGKEKLESTKKELDSVKAAMKLYSKQLELKAQEFNTMQLSIEETRHALYWKEKQLSSVQKSIQECGKQLKREEEKLNSIKKSILESSKELRSKEQQVEAIKESQKKLSEELELKEKELGLLEKTCNERLQEANLKEKHLDSCQRSLEECSEKLETEKKQFEARVKEFELKEKEFVTVQKAVEQRSKELEVKEKQLTNALHSQVRSGNSSSSFSEGPEITNTETANLITPSRIKTEQLDPFMNSNTNETSSAVLGVGGTGDGRSSRGISDEHLIGPDLRQNEVLAALQTSKDPARFVLDLMLGTYSQHQNVGGTGFEEGVLKIYVLMLEQLLQVSPLVEPDVRADAMKLAMEWKLKMKLNAENSFEVLGFLLFVAAFGLVSYFNGDEIFKFLGTAAQHQQAQNVCKVPGFTDFIDSLIERKKYIEAVRSVCAFGFEEKFPPEQLLKQFWDDIYRVVCHNCETGNNSPEALEKATDEEIAALKSLMKCIMDCKLGSIIPAEVIQNSIAELENTKMNRTFSLRSPSAVQPKVQSWTNCNIGTLVPRSQPSTTPSIQRQFQGGICASTSGSERQELSNKRARTHGPPIRSHTPEVPTLSNPYFRSSSPAFQYGFAANLGHSSNLLSKQLNIAQEQYMTHNRFKQL